MPISTLRYVVFAFLAMRLITAAAPAAADDDQKTLDELIGGETFTVGDKLFYDWELVENRSTASADPLQTLLGAVKDEPSLVRLRFDGDANKSLYAEGNELIDVTFRFKVKALDPKQRLKDVGLSLRYGDANDIMNITEFVFDPGGSIIDLITSLSVGPSHTEEHEEFEPREVIIVEKHILMGGGINFETFEPEVSYIKSFGQDFSQTTVPEPATWVLIILAAAGWCLRRGRAA